MNKIPCKIIEDLLPMYIDQVCSNETKEIIENHLKQCDKCAKIFHLCGCNMARSGNKATEI